MGCVCVAGLPCTCSCGVVVGEGVDDFACVSGVTAVRGAAVTFVTAPAGAVFGLAGTPCVAGRSAGAEAGCASGFLGPAGVAGRSAGAAPGCVSGLAEWPLDVPLISLCDCNRPNQYTDKMTQFSHATCHHGRFILLSIDAGKSEQKSNRKRIGKYTGLSGAGRKERRAQCKLKKNKLKNAPTKRTGGGGGGGMKVRLTTNYNLNKSSFKMLKYRYNGVTYHGRCIFGRRSRAFRSRCVRHIGIVILNHLERRGLVVLVTKTPPLRSKITHIPPT